MKFYPRLKIWKNATGTATFDGKEGYSFNWYCIALVLPDGREIVNRNTYSSTTAKHIGEVRSLFDHECLSLTAPRGLKNTSATERALVSEREVVKGKLARARQNKDCHARRLVEIEAELKLNAEIAEILSGGRGGEVETAA